MLINLGIIFSSSVIFSTAAQLTLFLLFSGNRVLRAQRELSKRTEEASFPGSL